MSFPCLFETTAGQKPFLLRVAVVRVGKGDPADFQIDDPSVSREHASLERLKDGSYLLVDAGSRNGTFVNGIAIQQRKLREGDTVTFGLRSFAFGESDFEEASGGEELQKSYETSIALAGKRVGETRVLGSDKRDSRSQVQAATAWHFFRRFLESKENGAAEGEEAVLVSILDDLSGVQGIAGISFMATPGSRGVPSTLHRGAEPGISLELLSQKMQQSAQGGTSFSVQSGVFREACDHDEPMPEAVILSISGVGCLFVEGNDLPGLTPETLSVARGAVEAIRTGVELGEDTGRQVREASLPKVSVEHGIVGRSAALSRSIDHARKAARYDAPVLITGPTGSGKELFAHLIHDESVRSSSPICIVACNELFEQLGSELFGQERGAFTDAKTSRAGAFERAHGGTVFLDEIGELSSDLQARLLRVLESKSVQRLGGEKRIETDFRLVAATNRDLEEEVAEGRFREDLLYRISTVKIGLPPLGERLEDIPDLARHFAAEFCRKENAGPVQLEDSAMEALMTHPWPGNVRQLKNVVENSIIFRDQADRVTSGDIVLVPEKEGSTPAPDASFEEVKEWHFRRALRFFEGNRKKTAEQLGVARSTFHEWLAKQDESGS